jgi:hypothetical protein
MGLNAMPEVFRVAGGSQPASSPLRIAPMMITVTGRCHAALGAGETVPGAKHRETEGDREGMIVCA